jgi:hypothetical protein
MTIEKVEKGGRRYLKFARRKLAQLDALRRDIGLQAMSKAYKIGSSLIWIKASEWKDLIYITGGPLGFLVRAWTNAARTANYLSGGTGLRFARNLEGQASWSRDYSTFAGTDSTSDEVHLRRTTHNSITGEQDTVVAGSISAALSLWDMYVPDVASMSTDGKRVIVATGASVKDGAFKHMEWNEATKVFDEVDVALPPELAAMLAASTEYAFVGNPYDDDPATWPLDSKHTPYDRTVATWTPSFGPTAVAVIPLYTRIKIAPHGEPRVYVEVVTLDIDPPTIVDDQITVFNTKLFVGEVNARALYKVWEYRADTQVWAVWHEETFGDKYSIWYIRDHVFPNSLTVNTAPKFRFPRVGIVFDSDGAPRRLSVAGGGYTLGTGPTYRYEVWEQTSTGIHTVNFFGSPPAGFTVFAFGLPYPSGGVETFDPEINLQLDDVPFISDVADDGQRQGEFQFAYYIMLAPEYMLPVIRNVGQADRGAIVSRWTGLQASTGRKGLVWRWGTFGEEYTTVGSPPATTFSRSARWALLGTSFYLDGASTISVPGTTTVYWPSYSGDDRWTVKDTTDVSIVHIVQLRPPLGEPEGAYGIRPPLNEAGDAELSEDEYAINLVARDPVYGAAVVIGTHSSIIPDDFIAAPAIEPIKDIVPTQVAPALTQLYRGHLPTSPITYFPVDPNEPDSGVPADATGAWRCSGTSLRWHSRDLLMLYYGEYDIVVDGPALDPIVCVAAGS